MQFRCFISNSELLSDATSAAFKSALTSSSPFIKASSLFSRDCLDLVISSLAFCIFSASSRLLFNWRLLLLIFCFSFSSLSLYYVA